LTFNGPHGIIPEKRELFIITAARTSNRTSWKEIAWKFGKEVDFWKMGHEDGR
jgi:hypothetical protein